MGKPFFVMVGVKVINLAQVAAVSLTPRGYLVIQFANGGEIELGGETAQAFWGLLEAYVTDLTPKEDA